MDYYYPALLIYFTYFSGLVHDVEEYQQVHGKQAESGHGNFVFGFIVEWLLRTKSVQLHG
jgi:hypothetical protein